MATELPIVIGGQVIDPAWGNAVRDSVNELQDDVASKLSKAGGTMTGHINTGGKQVYGLPVPTLNSDATTKNYVDTTTLGATGGQVTGDLVVATTGGGSPFTGFRGCELTTNGAIGSLRTSGTEGINLQLFKAGTAYAVGQHYAGFFGQTVATVRGAITQVSTGVLYQETSDYRLKDDLGPIVDPVERMMQLQPKHLRMKEDGVEFDGFVAHEVQAVVPGAVTGEKDAMNGDDIAPQLLDSKQLIPLLTAALQAAHTQIADLSARLDALEAAA